MGLRDRLRERQIPQATVAIRIDSSEAAQENDQKLADAKTALKAAEGAGGTKGVAALRAARDEAQAAVDAAYEYVTIRALPASDMEALLEAHPPTQQQVSADPRVYFNRITFYPALLAACIEGPESEQDWVEIIDSGEMVMGEVHTLISSAMELNDRAPNVSLGKGSTPTPS